MDEISLRAFYISADHDFRGHHGGPRGNNPIIEPQTIDCVAGQGIKGDRYFGFKEDFKGQITFFDFAVLQKLAASDLISHDQVDASKLRRNVLVEGLDLNELIGKNFQIGEVSFYGMEECAPCYWMDQAIALGTEIFLQGRGGLRAKITNSGTLHLGQTSCRIAK